MPKKFHIAIATHDIEASVQDYSRRLAARPDVVVPGAYALWRTATLNISVRQAPDCQPGELRHVGWEDEAATEFSTDIDCNGILWETFAAAHQIAEINEIWPETNQ